MINSLKLKGNELIIYALIYGFTQDGEQWFEGSRQYLAEWCNSTKQGVQKNLKSLVEKGLLIKEDVIVNSADIVDLLKNKNMRGLGVGSSTCQWCEVNTSILHEHHYPIPKSKGGTETVAICPNCHHEFHSMSDIPKYKVNTEILADFDIREDK